MSLLGHPWYVLFRFAVREPTKSSGMNNDSNPKTGRHQPLPPISAEEFDAKFDAGEDVSGYFDWDKAVMVEPGELSPGQKLSLTKMMLDDLLKSGDLPPFSPSEQEQISVSLSPLAFVQVGQEAARRHVSREELVESWIEQKLEEHKAEK